MSGALDRDDANKWYEAMEDEYNSLISNYTWKLVDKPKDGCDIPWKWIFKVLLDASGNDTRHKARLAAKGYKQTYGINYDEIFDPVVRKESLRLLIGIAAEHNLKIDHMDVKTTFLNGDFKEIVY